MGDIYGVQQGTLDGIKQTLEEILAIRFEDRYSKFLGGDYCRTRAIPGDYSSSSIKIVKNFSGPPINEGWYEEGYQEYEFIIEVEEGFDPSPDIILNRILSKSKDIVPLERSRLNDEGDGILVYVYQNNQFVLRENQ